jgi:hypothetical protein
MPLFTKFEASHSSLAPAPAPRPRTADPSIIRKVLRRKDRLGPCEQVLITSIREKDNNMFAFLRDNRVESGPDYNAAGKIISYTLCGSVEAFERVRDQKEKIASKNTFTEIVTK